MPRPENETPLSFRIDVLTLAIPGGTYYVWATNREKALAHANARWKESIRDLALGDVGIQVVKPEEAAE